MQNIAGNALQIRRLQAIRNAGLLFLIPLLVLTPFFVKPGYLNPWPEFNDFWFDKFHFWIPPFVIALMGAIGGLVSGLFKVRTSQVSFKEYQENVTKLVLKPITGALVALLLYIFLTWDLLSIIKVDNAGSYIIVAFLAGFSERYFLQRLNIETGEEPGRLKRSPQPEENDKYPKSTLNNIETQFQARKNGTNSETKVV
jgi:hypothetical protein